MKRLALVLALVPALALSAPERPARGPGNGAGRGPNATSAPDDVPGQQRMQKRMRLALTLGLAEALDLDEPATLRVRDAIGRNAERRLPLRQQVRDGVRVIRSAARGDPTAMGQVDGALAKVRDARNQLRGLDDELLEQVTQGLSPDRKAKAALFLARFHERARHMAGGHRLGLGPAGGRGGMPGGGPGGGPGVRGGRGSGGDDVPRGPMGFGLRREDHPMAGAGGGAGDPDLADWFADE